LKSIEDKLKIILKEEKNGSDVKKYKLKVKRSKIQA
jgi:hypothetical protein